MPKCTVLYIKVHCHNRLTNIFFSSRTVKASPFIFASERRECDGKRQYRAWANTMAGSSACAGMDRWDGSRRSHCWARKARPRLGGTRDSLMIRKDSRQTPLSTEAQRGGWTRVGEGWRTFPNTQVGSRNCGEEEVGGAGRRATVQSKAKLL